MKVADLDIRQWQDLLTQAAVELERFDDAPIAMRCENTQLSVGWDMGGFTLNGHRYTAFGPRDTAGQFAMIAVRDDFLRWVSDKLKGEAQ